MSGFAVKFVLVDNSNQDVIHEAAKAVQNAGLATQQISESTVQEITEKDSCLYVCDPFEGKAFEHLLNHGCRIIGPQCVLSCLRKDIAIPKTTHPIYNICMRGVEISCSSIEKREREIVHKLVQWMGGRVSRNFTENVTHLIAGEVGSKKYFVAADLMKPIMLPDWIHVCWERSQGIHFNGTSADVIQEFSCPIFKGCIICVTGVESDTRKEVKQLVDQHGGRYTGELKFKECTHLIVNVNGPKGQKYEFARKWKIPCVTIKWFFDCIDKGSCQNEDLYKAENTSARQVKSSTPKGQGEMPRPPRISSIADYSAIGESTVNETAMTTAYDSIMSAPAAIGGKQNDSMEELDALNVSDYDGNLFLDGCKILLSGFSGSRLEKLRKVINAGGGTRFNQLNASVSHVVIGDKVQEHHDLLLQGKFRPVVVSAQWIIDSFKQGEQVDDSRYSVLDLPAVQTMSPQVKAKAKLSANASNNDTTIDQDGDKTMENIDDDVIAMYRDDNKTDGDETTDSEVMFNPKPEGEQEGGDQDETQVEQQDMDITACIQQDGVGIFAGKRFIIVGFPQEQETQIQEMIALQQGTVLGASSRYIADYAVVPVTGCPVKATVNEVTTNCWLQICIETEECLEPASNALFTPITLVEDAVPLQGCVMSISQYAGVERDCLLHLAELLGATCQEYFVRKPSGILQTNTHLLLKEAEGSKYKAAKKWKIPTVTKEWLLECAKTGKKQPESNFPVDVTSPQSTLPPSTKTAKETTTSKDKSANDNVEFKQPDIPSTSRHASTSKRTSAISRENQDEEPASAVAASSVTDANDTKPVVGNDLHRLDESSSPPRTAHSDDRQKVVADNRNSPVPSVSRPHRTADDLKENMLTPVTAAKVKATNKLLAGIKSGVGNVTPSKFLGDRTFRPSFDLDDVNAFLDSPGTQHLHRKSSMRRKSSLPLDDLFSVNLAKAVANTGDMDDDGESQSQDDSVFQEQPPGILENIVICVGKKLSKKQGEYNNIAASLGAEYKWLYDESCTHFVFQGRANDMSKEFKVAKEQGKIIVSPHWLLACQEQNAHVDESQYPHTYNPKLTLPVMTSKTPARSMPARGTPARATRQSARKTTQQSARKTQRVAKPISPPPQPEIAQDGFENKDSTDSDEEMMKITEAAEEQAEAPAEEQAQAPAEEQAQAPIPPPLDAEGEGSLEMRENFQKQFEEIMTSTSSGKSGRRRSRRQASTSGISTLGTDETSSTGRRTRSKRATLAGTSEEQEMGHKLGRVIESSQQITWDDPTSRKEREKIMAQLKENGTEEEHNQEEQVSDKPETPQKSVRLDDKTETINQPADTEDSPPTPTPMAPPIRLPVAKPAVAPQPHPGSAEKPTEHRPTRSAPKFLLSGMSNDEKVDYGALIEQLGGEVKDAQYFDPSCTHVIVGNPTRNEKYLASLASGKWVLHKSYMEACREQQIFVGEEDHEWGSATDLNSIPPQTVKLALAATRWRHKLDEERKKSDGQIIPGAFDGWRVLLHVDRARESGFKRLLQAGGAKIVCMRPPFANCDDGTHGFFDFGKAKSTKSIDLESIVSAGVLCLKPEYIAQYLMEEPLPDPANYCINEVKTILERLNSYSERTTMQANTPTPSKRKRESSMGTRGNKKSKR